MLDLCADQNAEARSRCEEKIASGVLPLCLFFLIQSHKKLGCMTSRFVLRIVWRRRNLLMPLIKIVSWMRIGSFRSDSCIWDISIAQRAWWRDKKQRIVSYKTKFRKLQANIVIFTKRTKDSATRLKDQIVVWESEHCICHTKFKSADLSGDWIVNNPEDLSYFCDLTSCDLPSAALLEFAGFRDHWKDVGDLVIERRAKFGTLKSDYVGERGARVDTFRSDLWLTPGVFGQDRLGLVCYCTLCGGIYRLSVGFNDRWVWSVGRY